MRIAFQVVAYLLVVAIVALLGYMAWFAYLWGFNPLGLVFLYIVGLLICSIIILIAVAYRGPKKPSAN